MSIAIELDPISAGAKRTVSLSMDRDIDSGVLLTAVATSPTATEDVTTDLTITDVAINAAQITVKGEAVAIGRGLQFTVDAADAVSGRTYTITVTVFTDSTPAERLVYDVILPCV